MSVRVCSGISGFWMKLRTKHFPEAADDLSAEDTSVIFVQKVAGSIDGNSSYIESVC